MRSIDEFKQFYEQTLQPQLENLDKIRKRYLFTTLRFTFYLIAVILLFFVVLSQSWVPGFIKGIWILVSIGLFIYIVYKLHKTNKNNEYKKLFKGEVIQPIVKFISEDLEYHPKRKIPKSLYRKSRLFLKDTDRFKGDDLIEGKIDKTVFHFSELHTQYKTQGNKGQTHWHDIFKGIFFIADFNKEFDGSTVLLPNQIGGGFSFFKKIFGLNRKEKLVELADPEFTDNFTCYSTDDIKARYILTPALMERLNRFHKKYPDNRVALSFVDGQIFVAISYHHDLFEPSYFKSVVNYDQMQSYFDDIRLVVEIVEDLNLNNRIWTKE